MVWDTSTGPRRVTKVSVPPSYQYKPYLLVILAYHKKKDKTPSGQP